ncbi:MAG: YihY family inner membrane protein [Alphaproteobacteria bacterium]|nr:YihY family inner membrane protein [Alphaproteobacteria bacterium]
MSVVEHIKSWFNSIRGFIYFLIKRAQNDTVLRVASSLSYTSLIALVPVLAIALAVFSAFPVFADVREQIQEIFIQNLMPDAGQDISTYFNDFIKATAKLTTIGVVGIALTAVLLLSTIENSFNFIFKVTHPRRWTTKITLYWTVITLGPLLLGTALSLKGMFVFNKFADTMPDLQILVGNLLPSVITCLLLIGVYVFIPNKKVSVSSALVGALTAMVLFLVLRQGFALFMLKNNTYKTLYGAVAAVPLMLVWMYLYWAVVIFGAVVTAALDEYRELDKRDLKKIIVKGKPNRR